MSSLPIENVYTAPPDFMADRVHETAINSAGTGPFAVYSPGLRLTGLKNMIYLFNEVPAGVVFKIDTGETWSDAARLPEAFASKRRVIKNYNGHETGRHHARQIPAEITLDALMSDRSLTEKGLTQVPVFGQIDARIDAFNSLIHPEFPKPKTFPPNFQHVKLLKAEGMLAVRKLWLEQAYEALETGRMLEDIRRVTDSAPFLIDVWMDAIAETLLPQIEVFKSLAETKLAEIEEQIQSKEMKVYDTFAHTLMWLLGRKMERTALSRTLETVQNGGRSSSAEEIKAVVETIYKNERGAQIAQAPAPAQETVQCPNCGNKCEAIAGGPPRICWRCKYEFIRSAQTAAPVSTLPIEEVRIAAPVSEVDDEGFVSDPDDDDDANETPEEMAEKERLAASLLDED